MFTKLMTMQNRTHDVIAELLLEKKITAFVMIPLYKKEHREPSCMC